MFLKKELIFVNKLYSTNEEALREMANEFVDLGVCKQSYPQAILDREKKYATGLPTSVGTAISHCDPEHVVQAAMGVTTLCHPVKFGQMGGGEDVDVSIIFMLAVKEAKAQVPTLQKLMKIIQDSDMLHKIIKISNGEALYKLLVPVIV